MDLISKKFNMEKLIKQWEEKLSTYQLAIDVSVHDRDKSFNKGKKAALEIALEELKFFIYSNPMLADSCCPRCGH